MILTFLIGLALAWLVLVLRAAPSGHFRAGKNSRAQANGQKITCSEWSATYNGMDLDVTNFESNGFDEGIIGILDLTWSLNGHWDAAINPNADPPGLLPTDSGTNLFLYPNTSDLGIVAYQMPKYRCFSGKASSTVKGLVEFTANGKSQGSFTAPTSVN